MFIGKFRLFILFLAAVICIGRLTGCKAETPATQDANEPNNAAPQQPAEPNSPPTTTTASAKPANPPADSNKPTLGRIIATRNGWDPAYLNWYGKQSPDFTKIDLAGKKHTIGDYRGRNVMLVFWATWCRPCIREIPHLIELRKTIPEDKLVILAISYIDPRNTTEMVKKFVADNPIINYPVVSVSPSALPRPYNNIIGIPCTFYIDPQGKIKFTIEGVATVTEMKAILEAER